MVKILFASILLIIYLFFAIFAIAIDDSHHSTGKCLSVTINGYACPNSADDYNLANFHIKALKTFSTSILNYWIFENLKLADLAVAIILILKIISSRFQKSIIRRFHIYHSSHLSWLSLFELSPTLKYC